MSVTLLLLRHGQIKANKQRRWHGSTDSALTLKGRIQAALTSRALRKRGNIHATYTSPLQRCRHTGALASSHTTHRTTVIDGLAEMSIGDWEGKKFTELYGQYKLLERCNEDLTWRPPNGESLDDVAQRMASSLQHIAATHNAGDTVLVVSHGAAMAIALATLLDNDPGKWGNYHFRNCSLTELSFANKPSLGRFNDCSHLGLFG